MQVTCQTVPSVDQFASGMIGFLDCQAQTLGSRGYQALAAPGSSASTLLAAMLTIFVAFIGYRMLFGETPTLREGIVSFVKIGIVLAFASSWPAYQTVIYDVVLRTPAELAAEIGAPAGLPGAAGGLPSRLDGVDQAFQTLAVYGVGIPPLGPTNPNLQPQNAPPLFAGFDTFAIGASRVVFLGSGIGGFALVRLAAGLLLALGPLFLAFLLFDGTRGLFEGWLRALIGTALGALATATLLGVELALLEPWLADLVARRAADNAITGVPAPLFATTVIFAFTLAGLLLIVTRVALGLRLPYGRLLSSIQSSNMLERVERSEVSASHRDAIPIESRSRAAAIADGISATQRREERLVESRAVGTASSSGTSPQGRSAGSAQAGVTPLGQTSRRRTTTRVSASAGVRDRGV